MASTDYTPRSTTIWHDRRVTRQRATVILLFGTAFAFHIAILLNLLPS